MSEMEPGSERVPPSNRRIFPFEMREDYVLVVTEGLEPTVMRLWTNGCLTELTMAGARRMHGILGDAIAQAEERQASLEASLLDPETSFLNRLTENGRYVFSGSFSPGEPYILMYDIEDAVYVNTGLMRRARAETVGGYPIPYIPDEGVVYLEGVGAIYRDGDEIRLDSSIIR